MLDKDPSTAFFEIITADENDDSTTATAQTDVVGMGIESLQVVNDGCVHTSFPT